MNPMEMMKLKPALTRFSQDHPKVSAFFRTTAPKTQIGSVIEITVTSPEGESITTNLRVTQNDLELVHALSSIQK